MNYRPISLLPILSKNFEKLIFTKIYEHITNNDLLTEKQSGYRPGHSTHIQLLYLTHRLYSALNNNKDFTAVFLDISKYFDKIWHKGLIEKCKIQYSISGHLLSWLTSYLKDRTQIVRVGNSLSSPEKNFYQDVLKVRCLDLCWQSCISTTYLTKHKMTLFSTQTTLHYIALILMAAKMTNNQFRPT